MALYLERQQCWKPIMGPAFGAFLLVTTALRFEVATRFLMLYAKTVHALSAVLIRAFYSLTVLVTGDFLQLGRLQHIAIFPTKSPACDFLAEVGECFAMTKPCGFSQERARKRQVQRMRCEQSGARVFLAQRNKMYRLTGLLAVGLVHCNIGFDTPANICLRSASAVYAHLVELPVARSAGYAVRAWEANRKAAFLYEDHPCTLVAGLHMRDGFSPAFTYRKDHYLCASVFQKARVAYHKRKFDLALLNCHPASLVARHRFQCGLWSGDKPQGPDLSLPTKLIPLRRVRCEIRLWDGTVRMLDGLYETDTAATLKREICSQLALPRSFRVTVAGKDLDDSCTLDSTGLTDGGTVCLNLRIRGGKPSSGTCASSLRPSSGPMKDETSVMDAAAAVARLKNLKLAFDRRRTLRAARNRRYRYLDKTCPEKKTTRTITRKYDGKNSSRRTFVPSLEEQREPKKADPPIVSTTRDFSFQASQERQTAHSNGQQHLNSIRVGMGITEQELLSKLDSCAQKEASRTRPSGNREQGNGEEEDDGNDDAEEESTVNGSGESFFDDRLKCPAKSIILYYLNSGMMRFQKHREYMASWEGREVDVDALVKEISAEKLTETEAQETVRRFLIDHPYTCGRIQACGSCGIREMERKAEPRIRYVPVYLDDGVSEPLRYGYDKKDDVIINSLRQDHSSKVTIPINENWDTRCVDLKDLRSHYIQHQPDGSTTYWHLHPELVKHCPIRRKHYTVVCPECLSALRKAKRPALSIAGGVDFGHYRRVGLEPPNLLELQILSRMRLFFATVKVSSNQMGVVNRSLQNTYKCHAILFRHDAPNVASYMFNSDIYGENGILNLEGLKGLMQIYMVDHKARVDSLFRHVFGTANITARPWVVAQWLTALKWSHPFYRDLMIGNIDRVVSSVRRMNAYLEESAVKATDPKQVAFERGLGDDIAEVQHAEVRTDQQWAELNDERRAELEQEGQGSEEDSPDSTGNASPSPLSFSFVTPTEQGYLAEHPDRDFRTAALSDLAKMTEREIDAVLRTQEGLGDFIFDRKKAVDDYLEKFPANLQCTSRRVANPLCDFSNDDAGIATCFPHIFMLGKAYAKQPGRLTQVQRNHLLNQFTQVPATDRRLLGFLFDLLQRTRVFDGVKQYVQGNAKALKALRALIEDAEERAELRRALEDPCSAAAKKTFGKYYPHLRYAGKNVSYGAVEGTGLKHQMEGLNRRFSSVSSFITISPANCDNPRAVRCSFQMTDNATFPSDFPPGCPYGANAKEFLARFNRNGASDQEGVVYLPSSFRSEQTMQNPVAFVQENKTLLHDIMTLLLGLPPENPGFYARKSGCSARKTRYYRRTKGVFGYPLYTCGVTEDHLKGTLHVHINHAAGMSAYLMQRFADLPRVCDIITEVLDSMYQSRLSLRTHVSSQVRQCLKGHYKTWKMEQSILNSLRPGSVLSSRADVYHGLSTNPSASLGQDVLAAQVDLQGGVQNLHCHSTRCFKPPHGYNGCGLDMPQACTNATGAVVLVPSSDPASEPAYAADGHDEEAPRLADIHYGDGPALEYRALPARSDILPNGGSTYRLRRPLRPDVRPELVVWETARPLLTSEHFNCDLSHDPSAKEKIISAFQNTLGNDAPVEQVSGDPLTFWQWMHHVATDEQLLLLYNYVREKLPMANGYVATFNPILSFCTSSHNNSCLLGSLTQARSAMFYIIPYQAKRKVELEQCLPILDEVLQHMKKHPSEATDSGTVARTVKHFLTRVINQMHLRMEISDWQVAAALLELPSMFTTEKFSYGNPTALANLSGKMKLAQDSNEAFSNICNELSAAERQAAQMNRSVVDRWFRPTYIPTDEDHPEEASAANPVDQTTNGDHGNSEYDRYAVGQELGLITQAKINKGGQGSEPERCVLFPATAWYYYRGDQLSDMTYNEYLACVDVENKKPSAKRDDPFNLKAQKQFRTCEDFICYADCYQVLRKKQCTPLTTGPIPPHPGPPPADGEGSASAAARASWKDKADQYARFYLAYFRPFREGDTCDWQALEEYAEYLQGSSRIIDTFRLQMMEQHMTGMKVPSECVKMSRDYRTRSRDQWTAQEKTSMAIEREREDSCRRSQRYVAEFENTDSSKEKASEQAVRNWEKQLHHDSLQLRALLAASPPATARQPRNPRMWRNMKCRLSAVQIQRIADDMKEWRPTPELDDTQPGKTTTTRDRLARMAKIRDELLTQQKTGSTVRKVENQQTALLDTYITSFAGTSRPGEPAPPSILLLHGPPGAGKTTTRDAFHRMAGVCGRFVFKVSFNAINAVEMGGFTVCSHIGNNARVHMDDTGKFHENSVNTLRDMGFQRDSIVTIEEFETCAPWHLARLSRLCQIANNTNLPFGGCTVLLIGDLGQLNPVRSGANITQAIYDIHLSGEGRKAAARAKTKIGDTLLTSKRKEEDKYRICHPYRMGSDILTASRWYELNQQHRSQDPLHTELIMMTYKRHRVRMPDLKDRGYKHLHSDDTAKEEWLRASALVATNRERFSLAHFRAVQLARFLGKPVVRWLSHYKWGKNQPPREQEELILQDPCFYELFVQDSDGYICDGYMKALRLINGTRVRYKSLVFASKEDEQVFRAYLQQAQPGDIITLREAPLAVVVEVLFSGEINRQVTDALAGFSLEAKEDGTFLLPIMGWNNKWMNKPIPIPTQPGLPPTSAYIKPRFPIENAFAITVHKALGRTIDRVILALSGGKPSGCNFSYRQLHVALSRVRMREHIRLLLIGETESDRWRSLAYLDYLKPDPSMEFFFAGFRPYDVDNPNTGWMDNAWSADRANAWCGEGHNGRY